MKLFFFIGLMFASGCAITPETTKRIAKENARLNDRICVKINELRDKSEAQGVQLIELEEYINLVNSYAKRSYQVIECIYKEASL